MNIHSTGAVSLEDADLDVSGGGGEAYFVRCDRTTMTEADLQRSGKAVELLEFTVKSEHTTTN